MYLCIFIFLSSLSTWRFFLVCVLYCQICHSWQISYWPPWEKHSNTVHNATALQNPFVLKWYRSCLCSSFNADDIITYGALSMLRTHWCSLLLMLTPNYSQKFLLCLILDDHKCKHWPVHAIKCEWWYIFSGCIKFLLFGVSQHKCRTAYLPIKSIEYFQP